MTKIKSKAKSKAKARGKLEGWIDSLQTYHAEINEREDLVETLTHYRDGCTDEDWLIIHKAIKVMKDRIIKMRKFHDRMKKKNES